MTHSFVIRNGLAAASLFLSSLAVPTSSAFAAQIDNGPSGPSVEITQQDVAKSNEKVGMAYSALVTMWTNDFNQIGERFQAPRIARYNRTVMTACGPIGTDNAEYCPRNNTIYYDEVFVAGMAKTAASALSTDGDMAGLGIVAHEMGHAVAMQLGHQSRNSYDNEATADCLAGAFAEQSKRDGSLEKGDVEEAFFGMSLAGDPTPQSTGNARRDAMILARLARESHGTKEQRMNNFRTGLDGGAKACLEELQGVR